MDEELKQLLRNAFDTRQSITKDKLKHPRKNCVSTLDGPELNEDFLVTWEYSSDDMKQWCIDGLNGIDRRITFIVDSGDDFRTVMGEFRRESLYNYLQLVLWLAFLYVSDEDENVSHNAMVMLKIIAVPYIIQRALDQNISIINYDEAVQQKIIDKYCKPSPEERLDEGLLDYEEPYKGWYDEFMPYFIRESKHLPPYEMPVWLKEQYDDRDTHEISQQHTDLPL